MIDRSTWTAHRLRNQFHSLVLLGVMGCFMSLLGWLIWGGLGIVLLGIVCTLLIALNPSVSPWWVMRLYGAQPIGFESAPSLWRVIAELAQRADLPSTPRLYFVATPMVNAFAVGSPSGSAIAVTSGLLNKLSLREICGVLAHEVSHIQNRDLWVMGLADLFSRLTSILSLLGQLLLLVSLPAFLLRDIHINWWAILLLIFAPNVSSLAQLALSRTREFNADLNAASLTGDAKGLASALVKIDAIQGGWMERIALPGRRIPDPSLLRTHPKTQDRVERLMSLEVKLPPLQTVLQDIDNTHFTGPSSRAPRWRFNGLWY